MPTDNPTRIGVLFYNTHLFGSRLPLAKALAKAKGDRLEYLDLERAELIGIALANFGQERAIDVVGLCEVWDNTLSELILGLTSSVFPHHYRPAPHPQPGNVLDSGLLFLSKYPFFRQPEFSAYWRESATLDPLVGGESDAHSQKGFLRAILNLPSGKTMPIFVTHLQAGADKKYQKIRKSQLEQVAFYLSRTQDMFPKSPVVLMGDLNLAAEAPSASSPKLEKTPEYVRALKILGLRDAYRMMHPDPTTMPAYTSDPPNKLLRLFHRENFARQRLDYVLIGKGKQVGVDSCEIEEFRMSNPINDSGADVGFKIHHLSDHYGIRAALSLA